MERVPYDTFTALLHANETVLHREAAQAWRDSMNGGGGDASLIEEIKVLRLQLLDALKQHAATTGQVTLAAHAGSSDKIVAGVKEAAKTADWDRRSTPTLG